MGKTITKLISLLAVFALSAFMAAAQNKTVSGKVTYSDGSPIVGAYVVDKANSSNGVTTGLNGEWSLNVPQGATLVFSFIGMETQEAVVGASNTINVTLQDSAEMLEEMVVIGYGSVKKADLTGAVSVVKTEEFKNKVNLSIGDALQGLAAGVSVRSGGDIGSIPTILIRGTANLSNNDPLYIIDGIPTSNNINFNVEDIETIQVLKDASAAAIYGSRAANGVIIITTKNGKAGKPTVEFSTKLALSHLPTIKFAHAAEWKGVYDLGVQNAIAEGVEGVVAWDHWNNDTDWQKEFFKTGFNQEYNLAFSNGNDNGAYRASFSYVSDDGVTLGRGLERITGRVNSSTKLGVFTFGENILVGHNKIINNGGTMTDVIRMIPTIPVYPKTDAEKAAATTNGYGRGSTTSARSLGSNPVASANTGESFTNSLMIQGNVYAQVDFTSWLKYKLSVGTTLEDSDTRTWSPGYATALNGSDSASSASASTRRSYHNVIENTLSFNKQFGAHTIDAVLGQAYEHTTTYSSSVTKQNLVSTASGDFLKEVDAASNLTNGAGVSSQNALISYFARLNYDYDGKYLASATVRHDGSSRFSKDFRWGTFPSFSLAWRISREDFFNVDWIDDLKIRANYGTLGSQNVGDYDYQMFVNSNVQYNLNGSTPTMGQAIVDLANNDLTWETLVQQNYGFDVAFLNNRLQLSAEYYKSDSKDVLTTLQLLKSSGSSTSPYVNAASITNQGVEVTLTWRDQIGRDFNYSVSANFAHSKNTLTDFGYGKLEEYTSRCVTRVGHSIGAFYLIETDGLFQSQEEVQNYISPATGKPIQPECKPGDIRYKDANNDGQITDADRVVIDDKSPWPKLEAGLTIMAQYKNFDFTLAGYGKFGVWTYNNTRMWNDNLNDCNALRADCPWWGYNGNKTHNAWYPRPLYSDPRNSPYHIDRWIEDSSFWRFNTISLGYTMKAPAILSNIFKTVRASVTGQNLVTFTKYTGFDPDFKGSLFEPGVDYQAQPSPKSVIFSLSIDF